MIDKTQNPAEIYLVPVFDGDHDHVWCDTPAPGEGMREEDATRYVREDIYLALQAKVEQLRDLLIRAVKGEQYIIESDLIAAIGSDLQSEISEAIDATPTRCLAEIKAQAVEEYCASFESMCVNQLDGDDLSQEMIDGWKAGIMDCRIAGRKYANQLRQQAAKEQQC